jgi:predicted TIM-barrel fold metal-dependent hydrolase
MKGEGMRKLFDMHAHLFVGKAALSVLNVAHDQLELVDRTEVLLELMNQYGTETSVIHCSHRAIENELIQKSVRKHPGRFIGFCRWGIGVSGQAAAEFIDKWLDEPEFKGVGEALVRNFIVKGKVETIPDALNQLRVPMEVIRARKVPIIFHTGYSGSHIGRFAGPLAWGDPLILDDIAREFWDVPIIIGHSGGGFPPYSTNALMMAYQHDNVFLDTSKSTTETVEKAVQELGAERLLWGTDWVREGPHPTGAKSERESHLYPFNLKVIEQARLSESDREKIFYSNAKSLLGLS